jgi:hypothetical protein
MLSFFHLKKMSLGPQFYLCVELESRHFIKKINERTKLMKELIEREVIVNCMLPKIRP